MGLVDFAKKLIGVQQKKKKSGKKTKKRVIKKPQKKAKKKAAKRPKKKVQKKLHKKPRKKPKKKSLRPARKPQEKIKEKEIGRVTHYFRKISVGAIELKAGLNIGDKIHIKGAHDDFKQIVKSMQINRQNVSSANEGDEIGIKVTHRVHENDKVYKVSS